MILGIESSCDDSAIALLDENKGYLLEWNNNQSKVHNIYGGVVPLLASKEHLIHLPLLFKECLDKIIKNKLTIKKIAVTYGPGLGGCLALGIAMSKSIALAFNVPIFGVNHLRGHAFSPFLSLFLKKPKNFIKEYNKLIPHLGMIVSGGNTIIFELLEDKRINVLVETIDDAAGEALDKGAKLLGMSYPGGYLIEKKAILGNEKMFNFPRSLGNIKDNRFSFSGVKTSFKYTVEKFNKKELLTSFNDLCASYQEAILDQLCSKFILFIKDKPYKSIGLSGGVSNNKRFRSKFTQIAKDEKKIKIIAESKHTGDNAAMIAFASYIDPKNCFTEFDSNLSFKSNLRL